MNIQEFQQDLDYILSAMTDEEFNATFPRKKYKTIKRKMKLTFENPIDFVVNESPILVLTHRIYISLGTISHNQNAN